MKILRLQIGIWGMVTPVTSGSSVWVRSHLRLVVDSASGLVHFSLAAVEGISEPFSHLLHDFVIGVLEKLILVPRQV